MLQLCTGNREMQGGAGPGRVQRRCSDGTHTGNMCIAARSDCRINRSAALGECCNFSRKGSRFSNHRERLNSDLRLQYCTYQLRRRHMYAYVELDLRYAWLFFHLPGATTQGLHIVFSFTSAHYIILYINTFSFSVWTTTYTALGNKNMT